MAFRAAAAVSRTSSSLSLSPFSGREWRLWPAARCCGAGGRFLANLGLGIGQALDQQGNRLGRHLRALRIDLREGPGRGQGDERVGVIQFLLQFELGADGRWSDSPQGVTGTEADLLVGIVRQAVATATASGASAPIAPRASNASQRAWTFLSVLTIRIKAGAASFAGGPRWPSIDASAGRSSSCLSAPWSRDCRLAERGQRHQRVVHASRLPPSRASMMAGNAGFRGRVEIGQTAGSHGAEPRIGALRAAVARRRPFPYGHCFSARSWPTPRH